MPDRPNILIVTTDQQRYDSLRCLGGSFVATPNLDRVAEEGASFQRSYCPNTVCTPSRVSIMTGLHLSRHGAYNIGTYAQDYSPFISSILTGAGYRTHHIGKAHWHPWETSSPENQPVDRSGTPYDDFAGFQTAEVCTGHVNWGVTGHYAAWMRQQGYNPEDFRRRDSIQYCFPDDPNDTGDWHLPVALHSGTWLAERAVAFLEQVGRSQPFYLNLGFQDPHHPHILPHDVRCRVDPMTVPRPELDWVGETAVAEHIPCFRDGTLMDSRFRGHFEMAGQYRAAWGLYFQDEHRARVTRAYYYSMVQLIDHQVGTILHALDALGLADNTLLVFTTDHGEMLGDHGIGQKGPLVYEGVTRIPLLMRYPDAFSQRTISDCVSLVDLAPTILDYVGLSDCMQRDGVSLRTLLESGAPLRRCGVRIEYKEEADRIRYKCWVTSRWKLAVYLGEEFGELYDLQEDPGERHNLYHEPDYQAVKAALLVELLHDLERSEPLSERPTRV